MLENILNILLKYRSKYDVYYNVDRENIDNIDNVMIHYYYCEELITSEEYNIYRSYYHRLSKYVRKYYQ